MPENLGSIQVVLWPISRFLVVEESSSKYFQTSKQAIQIVNIILLDFWFRSKGKSDNTYHRSYILLY
jgi:hypothetical protein